MAYYMASVSWGKEYNTGWDVWGNEVNKYGN